jgi:hypothetical protein
VDKDNSDMAKVRVVHDLSRPIGTSTNLGISIEHCSLPSVRDAFDLLRPKWFQAKVDLTSAYRSVPIHPDHWAHQCMEWDGIGYTDISSPFGVRSAVPLFDRLTQAIIRKVRSEGLSLQPWGTSMTSGYLPKLRKSACARIIASSNFCLTLDSWLTGINASRQRRV